MSMRNGKSAGWVVSQRCAITALAVVCTCVSHSAFAQRVRSQDDLARAIRGATDFKERASLADEVAAIPPKSFDRLLRQVLTNEFLRATEEILQSDQARTTTEAQAEYYGDLITVLSDSCHDDFISALATAAGTGGSVQRCLVGWGDQAIGPLLRTAEEIQSVPRVRGSVSTVGIILRRYGLALELESTRKIYAFVERKLPTLGDALVSSELLLLVADLAEVVVVMRSQDLWQLVKDLEEPIGVLKTDPGSSNPQWNPAERVLIQQTATEVLERLRVAYGVP